MRSTARTRFFPLRLASRGRVFTQFTHLSIPFLSLTPDLDTSLKAMSWVGVLNGQVVSTFWFVDADGDNVSINQHRYKKMLQQNVLPKLRQMFGNDLSQFWFQQVS